MLKRNVAMDQRIDRALRGVRSKCALTVEIGIDRCFKLLHRVEIAAMALRGLRRFGVARKTMRLRPKRAKCSVARRPRPRPRLNRPSSRPDPAARAGPQTTKSRIGLAVILYLNVAACFAPQEKSRHRGAGFASRLRGLRVGRYYRQLDEKIAVSLELPTPPANNSRRNGSEK